MSATQFIKYTTDLVQGGQYKWKGEILVTNDEHETPIYYLLGGE